ncbi:MAG: DUF4118 domain-containing protein [Chloroflexi bacterium]|nr:DUF4118 domain-containing protein [Chloroflexota bacterium]
MSKDGMLRSWGLRSSLWVGYAAAAVSVVIVTAVIAAIQPNARVRIANVEMLYLIAVLGVAAVFGSGPASLTAVLAFVTFDYFFIEPTHTFTIADPAEWVALLLFLLTAFVTGQLAGLQRRRAEEAHRRELEALALFDVSRLISGASTLDEALTKVLDRLRAELELAGAAVLGPGPEGELVVQARSGEIEVGSRDARAVAVWAFAEGKAAGLGLGQLRQPRVTGVALGAQREAGQRPQLFVPLTDGSRTIGLLQLGRQRGAPLFTAAENRLLTAAGAQLGLAIERARLRREALESEVLREADALKSALLDSVSHELRTPLASILASAGSLRQRDVVWSECDRDELVAAIEREASRLNRLVGNLLDLSRIEGGSLRPEIDWYSLPALVDDVLGRLRPMTEDYRIEVDVPEDLPPVPFDYVYLDQVLTNLVENAVRYTPPGTQIRIIARAAADRVEVRVTDGGPGIAPRDLGRIFEKFFRAGQPGKKPKGTGLGLAVAKGLVEAHGGRIWAESQVGRGTTIGFELPTRPLRQEEPAVAERERAS